MALLRRLYGRLHLTVNETKSAVVSVFGRKFLGYAFWVGPSGEVKRRVADKAIKAFNDCIRDLTPRVTGLSLQSVAERLRIFMLGKVFGGRKSLRISWARMTRIRHARRGQGARLGTLASGRRSTST